MYLGPSHQRPKPRLIGRLLGLVLVLSLISVLIGLVTYFFSTKNELEAELVSANIVAPVTIKFDEQAIPHIEASNQEDAWHALGLLHATERPWQMEFNRRLAAGKLSEILGKETVEVDQFIRTLGIRRAAEKQYENYPIEYKRHLQAYVDGVNEGLTRLGWALPPEFLILGVKPGHWSPADSVAWSLMMALDLGGNWHKEFLRLELSKTLSTEKIWQVLPPYPGENPPTSVNFAKMYQEMGLFKEKGNKKEAGRGVSDQFSHPQSDGLMSYLPGGIEGVGSNNWVVSGSKSASGSPLLANDPHLGLTSPAAWYMAHIQAPKLNVIGATLPGIPGVVIGHNTQVAWGFTNTDPDVQDLFIEAIDPDFAGRYKTPQGYENFILREETIAIKGHEPLRFLTRETRHGPVISDAYLRAQSLIDTQRFAISMRWTALDAANQTLVAGFQMNQAQNLEEFKNALKNYYAPMQNVVMADKDGQIAYRAAGIAPKRTKGQGLFGVAPALGWDKQSDWGPYFSQEALPKEINPKTWVATANHRVHAANDPHPLTSDWHLPYRHQRIENLLGAQDQHDMSSMKAIQTDSLSLAALDLLPLVQSADSNHKYAQEAKSILASFDGKMSLDSSGAVIFNAWAHHLTRLLFADKLGSSFAIEYGKRDFRGGLHHIMQMHQSGKAEAMAAAGFWCDKVSTAEIETCEIIINEALTLALNDLSKRLSGSPSSWKWGELHTAVSEHRPFSKVSLLKKKFEVVRPTPGDAFTVNVGFMNLGHPENPFIVTKGASLRVIYDLSNLNHSQFIYQTGQSGWVNHKNYSNYANAWSKQEYLSLSMSPDKIHHTSIIKPDPTAANENKRRLEKQSKELKR